MKFCLHDEAQIWAYSFWHTSYAALIRNKRGIQLSILPVLLTQEEYRCIQNSQTLFHNHKTKEYDLLFSIFSAYDISIDQVAIFEDYNAELKSCIVLYEGKRRKELIISAADGLYTCARSNCRLIVERNLFTKKGLSMDKAIAIADENLCGELEKALLKENYELAAEIRDHIAQVNKTV